MELINFIYLEKEIAFEIGQKDIMVNATEMAKIFEKYPKDFLILDSTKAFISSCLKKENSPYLNIKNEVDLFTSSQKSGTWMHRILALKFAAWLNSDFELWVYITIDKLLNQYFREQKEALIEKMTAKQQKEAQRLLIKEKYGDNDEIMKFFNFEEKEIEANKKRLKSIREQMKQLKLELNF